MRPSLLLGAVLLALACGDGAGPSSDFEWPRIAAAEAGLDQARLDEMRTVIENDLPNTNAVVIVRGGQVAFEWYRPGRDGYYPYDTRSVTKSWVAAFVGIAIQQGWITSLDQPVTDFFPELLDDQAADPRLPAVTLRHLMTMSAGIEDEQSNRFPAGTRDLVRKLLRTPLTHDPGSAFAYDGAQPHIVSGIIARLRNQNLAEIANDGLFLAMNIRQGQWLTDADGVSNGGTGLLMGALDLAKLGELYLRDGVWNGVRYLPAGFAELTAGTTSWNLAESFDYASLWWTFAGYGVRMWIAAGFRGQFVVVMPSLDMVVVLQSESYELRSPVITSPFPLIVDFIVPATQ